MAQHRQAAAIASGPGQFAVLASPDGQERTTPPAETGGELFPGTVNEVSARVYHDVFASYTLSTDAAISAGVDNISDETPPFFANADEANTDVSTYRLLGTSFWLRLNLWL